MCVVVIKSLLFDVLVLVSEHSMSQIEILSSLLKGHWFHVTTNLEIEKAHANCSLPEHHINCLGDCAISLIFELRVDGESNLSLCKFCLCHVVLNVVKFNDISSTILEPEKQTWFAFIVGG